MASTPSPTSTPMTTKKTQACDACRLRKVKCNGAERCQQCSHLNLRCIYSAPRARARTSTKRGALISRYKAESQGSPTATGSASPSLSDVDARYQSRDKWDRPFADSPDSANANLFPRLPSLADVVPLSSPTSNAPAPSETLARDTSYFLGFLPEYDKCVYPVNPIITTNEVRDAIQEMPLSREACTFVYAMTAVTVLLTPAGLDSPTLDCVAHWVNQAVLSKQVFASAAEVSPRMTMTSEFLHIACMALQKSELAFYYLREAITFGEMLRLDDAETLAALPPAERSRRQRLYGELYVHERYAAVTNYRPTILPPMSSLPEYEPSTPWHVHAGFSQIIQLFEILDAEFIAHWLASRTSHKITTTVSWIQNKHREIDASHAGSDEAIAHLTVMQQSDLIVTKHWMRTLVWQLALSNCLLGSSPSSPAAALNTPSGAAAAAAKFGVDSPSNHHHNSINANNHQSPASTSASANTATEEPPLSLTFPLNLSKSLRNLITSMSRNDIEVHGSGIQEKFFEITDAIANVMLASPINSSPQSITNMEDFVFLSSFVFSLPTLGTLQRRILTDKLSVLQRRFPFATAGVSAVAGTGAVGGSPAAGASGAAVGAQGHVWDDRSSMGTVGASPMG